MKIKSSIQINAPIDRVFQVYSEIKEAAERITGINKIEVLEHENFEIGFRWRETRKMFGKEATEVMWVTDLQPNQSYRVEAESNGAHYISNYYFSEKDGGTLVEMTFSGTPVTLFAKIMMVFFFLFKGSTEKALHQDMVDLKTYIESNPTN